MKKRNVVFSAIATIVLCVSIIAGSTYAIFTSSDDVNVAATSGTVKVTAAIDNESLMTYTKLTDAAGVDNTDHPTSFQNGGTAVWGDEGATLTLTNMTPGDGVKFNVAITNDSNVAIKYRVVVTMEDTVANDVVTGLSSALVVKVSNGSGEYAIDIPADSASGISLATDKWFDIAAEGDVEDITIDILFPNGTPEHDNDYQNTGCKINVRIEAVQGNADTTGVVVP